MSFSKLEDDSEAYPDEEAPYGSVLDLPWEAGDPNPQDIAYADLPEVSYDPKQDWRDTQKQALARLAGEFAPQEEEATDG